LAGLPHELPILQEASSMPFGAKIGQIIGGFSY
jgi:hypothetical protein